MIKSLRTLKLLQSLLVLLFVMLLFGFSFMEKLLSEKEFTKIKVNITTNKLIETLNYNKTYQQNFLDVIPEQKVFYLLHNPLISNHILTTEKVNETVYLTENTNLFNSFSEKSKNIYNLEKNIEIKRIAHISNGWDRIVYNDIIGYLPSNFLTTEKPIIQSTQNVITKNDISTSNSNNESNAESISYFCQADGYVDSSWLSLVDQQLNYVPSHILQSFLNDGWNIYVTDMNIDSVYYGGQYGAVMASTNYDEYRIIIEDRYDAVTESPIHELGHWLDWHFGKQSWGGEFGNIYSSEYESFKNTFGVTCMMNQEELFAEGFWRYITSGDSLQVSCPMLYNYINNKVLQL